MWKHKNFINLQLYAGETWVLNSTIVKPTWVYQNIDFVSNAENYEKIQVQYDGEGDTLLYNSVTVYGFPGSDTGSNVWTNQAYRTITFATAPTGDLLTWLQANGVKQSAPTLTFKHFYDAGTIGTGTYKFRHYSQQEPSSGETWVLNESGIGTLARTNVNFTSNNTSFSSIYCQEGKVNELYYQITDGTDIVAYAGTWSNTAYRTITFATSPTGDLLTWLQANGTKQGGGGVIKAGTYLFNEELTGVSSGNGLDLDFVAKGNSLTAVNVYGSQIDIEHIAVQDTGYLLLYTVEDFIEWDLYTWQYQHEVTEADWITYTADDTTKLRTIIVENNQNVDDQFYTWFTANTTKLS